MYLSACWIWLVSSIWKFLLPKLIVTLLFSPVSILCFLWWLTFHFSINAITRFNFNQQEYLFSKLDTKSSFAITEPTFFSFFYSRSDVSFWIDFWAEDFSQLDCGTWNHLVMLEKFLNPILLEASAGLSSVGLECCILELLAPCLLQMFWRVWNHWQYTPEQLRYLSKDILLILPSLILFWSRQISLLLKLLQHDLIVGWKQIFYVLPLL